MRSSQVPADSLKVFRPVLLLLLVSLLFGLIFFAYQGVFSRMMADDFCYGVKGREMGVINGLADIYTSWSGRYSTILLILATEAVSPWLVKAMPAIILALWLGSLAFLVSEIRKIFNPRLSKWMGWIVAATIIYLAILIAPNRFQVLYWMNGAVTYSFPLIGLTLLTAWSINLLEGKKPISIVSIAGFALLTLISGGFSETNAALQAGTFALGLALFMILSTTKMRKRAARILGTGLFFSLVSIAILASSPGNHIRQALFPQPPDVFQLIFLSMRYALAFIYHHILGYPLPLLFGGMVSLILGLLSQRVNVNEKPSKKSKIWPSWKMIILIAIGTFLLIVCCTAPSAYAQSAYPEARALLSATYILIIGITSAGLLLGYWLSSWLSHRFPQENRQIQNIILLILLIGCVYPFHASRNLSADVDQARAYAVQWDVREQTIELSINRGETDLILPGLNSQHGISDLQVEPDYWVNNCMADYYRVESITGK